MLAPYYSETDKAREIIDPKYLEGAGLDIGCGTHKIKPDSIGIDGRHLPGVDIITDILYPEYGSLTSFHDKDHNLILYAKSIKYIYSSHCLEHLCNPTAAIEHWARHLDKGGYFILYLPDRRKYSNEGNPEHMNDWDHDSFMFFFRRVFCGEGKDFRGKNFDPVFRLIESREDFRPDCYSFLVIAQKL